LFRNIPQLSATVSDLCHVIDRGVRFVVDNVFSVALLEDEAGVGCADQELVVKIVLEPKAADGLDAMKAFAIQA
jgi:hypothetical protein